MGRASYGKLVEVSNLWPQLIKFPGALRSLIILNKNPECLSSITTSIFATKQPKHARTSFGRLWPSFSTTWTMSLTPSTIFTPDATLALGSQQSQILLLASYPSSSYCPLSISSVMRSTNVTSGMSSGDVPRRLSRADVLLCVSCSQVVQNNISKTL
jgi:hypothetical protein